MANHADIPCNLSKPLWQPHCLLQPCNNGLQKICALKLGHTCWAHVYTASGATSVQTPGLETEVGLGTPAAYGEGLAAGPAGLGSAVAAGVAAGVMPGKVAAGIPGTPVS